MTLSQELDLSLVIACYNEGPHLRDSVLEVVQVLSASRLSYELIFVEDCSKDDTRRVIAEVVKELSDSNPLLPVTVLLHEVNKGRGATVRDGMRVARGRVMGFIDIDLEVHARYIPDLVRAIDNGFDIATGFRVYHVDGNNLIRHFLSVGYRSLMRKAISTSLKDTETGYKFFNRARCMPIVEQTQTDGWFWDTEVMVLAERAGLHITEIPVAFVRRFEKESTVNVIPDSVDYARRLMEFRARLAAAHGTAAGDRRDAGFGHMSPPSAPSPDTTRIN